MAAQPPAKKPSGHKRMLTDTNMAQSDLYKSSTALGRKNSTTSLEKSGSSMSLRSKRETAPQSSSSTSSLKQG